MSESNWINQMKNAMRMLHQFCSFNKEWKDCYQCPFDKYCDVILETFFITPDEDDFINFERE